MITIDDLQIKLLYQYLPKYFTDEEIHSLIDEYPLSGENGLRKMLGEIDPEYFCRAYLSEQFDRDFGQYASEILDTLKSAVESNAQENIAVVAPREHGKSTLSSLAIPVYCSCYKKKQYILFISANSDISENFLTKCKKALEYPAIIEDFGQLRDKKLTWNADTINTTSGVWISCSGWKSGLRGLNKDSRPDLIVLDDLEDKSVIESDSLRDKLDSAFKDEIGRLGTYNTDFFYIGTLLSDDSLLASVMKEPSWKTLFYQCVKSFPENESLWEEWKTIYRNLNNPNRMEDAYQYYLEHEKAMLKGVSVLWDGRFPDDKMKYKGAYYNIMLNREKWGEDSFWKEDQNEPRSSKDYIFQKLSYWNTLPSFDEMDIVLGVDPSMGKQKGDYSALTILGKHKPTGYKYVIDGQLHKVKPNELIEIIIKLCKNYPIHHLGFESVNFQEYIADDLKQRLKQEELYHVLVDNIKPRTNKHNRITNLEPFVTRSEILFNPNNAQYNDQVKTYNINAKNDDAPDCLQLSFELIEGLKQPKKIYSKPIGW